jgi:starch-binding outer membrane protein, SusD/RagB family
MKNYLSKLFYRPVLALLLFLLVSSCKKMIAVSPPDQLVVGNTAFESDAIALSTLTGIYSEMMNNGTQFSASGVTLYAGLCADEMSYYSPSIRDEFFKNELTPSSHGTLESVFWNPAYKYIYAANSVLEGVQHSTKLSSNVRNLLTGEAKFIRAFCFFHLVNFFGDVPLTLSTNYADNAIKGRTMKETVYGQIVSDLKDAQALLTNSYQGADRVRPNRWTATALLARTYLYRGEWALAEKEADNLLQAGVFTLAASPATVFLKSSTETIWQLQTVNPAVNTHEGNLILPPTATATPTYVLTPQLINSFEVNDQRRSMWTSTRTFQTQTIHYPSKYKVYGNNAASTEYYVVFRLAEQVLIRSEARAEQDRLGDAITDLNTLRKRAGLPLISNGLTKDAVLTAIEKERRSELFAEWGHRWFDLKRRHKADAVLSLLKPTTWQPSDVLFPIPSGQIRANPALTQNPGY